ncbi:ATP-binding protein [Streptomyces sp. NPDC046821]|uniref:ATP-binding protein n=1 Tax=Streptomyces sp. NPDC046821 TaxID=3154702 RepID=UPI003403AB58
MSFRAAQGTSGSKQPKTSTHRAFAALVDFLRFLVEENREEDKEDEKATRTLAENLIIRYYDNLRVGREEDFRDSNPSTFRDSQLLLALARLEMSRKLLEVEPPNDEPLIEAVREISVAVSDDILKKRFGIDESSRHLFHDYITLFAVRAVDAIRSIWEEEKFCAELTAKYAELADTVYLGVLAQLGAYHANDASRFDPAELAFRICPLHRLNEQGFSQIGGAALRAIKEAQSPNGSWPTARRVFLQHSQTSGQARELHIGSYDIALALSIVLCGEINRGRGDNADLLLDVLHGAFLHTKATLSEVGEWKGWSSDRTRPGDHVESWTTAVVLSFLDRYHTALRRLRQREILAKYLSVEHAKADVFKWPDLWPSIRSASGSEPTLKIFDPTESGKLKKKIIGKFLSPVKQSPVSRPEDVSLLLSGPPGTGKTSLVRGLAKSLNWTLLTLSPPDFLQGGLEKFEVSSANIFDDLMKLRRVVVLFDECEDFFRRRDTETSAAVSERTMGAFITAGMLPRLQRLREQGWLIFALSTNISIDQLDPAVIRPGRFDFEQYLPHPSLEAQRRYIKKMGLRGKPAKRLRNVLREWTEREGERSQKYYQPISFRVLGALIDFLKDNKRASEDQLEKEIRRRMSPGPPRLADS